MKYRNKKAVFNGETFDSKLELARYKQLLILSKVGQISCLKRQERFVLISKSKYGREIAYVADFTYQKGAEKVVEDVKSSVTKTRLYRLKKRLLAEKYGIVIKEVERTDL